MTRLTLEIFDDIVSALAKVQNSNDSGVEVEIPEGSILFENVLNLKLIKKHADRFGIVVHFVTNDPNGNNLIEMIEEGSTKFGTESRDADYEANESYVEMPKQKKSLPAIRMPSFGRINFKLPKMQLLPIIIALLLVIIYAADLSQQSATVKIIINSQPLARSITLKVKANAPTDAQGKVLAGATVQNTLDITKQESTTGTKLSGSYAEGKATIYNYTDSDHDFKKGQVLTYSKNSNDYNFVTQDTVTVPAEDLTDPANPTPGSTEVDIKADTVGDSYNLDTDKNLSVKGYKKSLYQAKITEKTTGGKSETKNVVSDADIKKVQTEIDQAQTDQASASLSQKIASSQTLVAGSAKFTVIQETPDHKVGDESDTISITRSVQVEGLVYLNSELDRLLDSLVKDFVPQGYVLSSQDRQVSTDVLGNSTDSTLSSTEADIQVTLKTDVVPDISADNIKKQLAGKSAGDAQKVLAGLGNVKSFEFHLNHGFIPLSNNVPKNTEKIQVEIVKQ